VDQKLHVTTKEAGRLFGKGPFRNQRDSKPTVTKRGKPNVVPDGSTEYSEPKSKSAKLDPKLYCKPQCQLSQHQCSPQVACNNQPLGRMFMQHQPQQYGVQHCRDRSHNHPAVGPFNQQQYSLPVHAQYSVPVQHQIRHNNHHFDPRLYPDELQWQQAQQQQVRQQQPQQHQLQQQQAELEVAGLWSAQPLAVAAVTEWEQQQAELEGAGLLAAQQIEAVVGSEWECFSFIDDGFGVEVQR
jgi:hypothetical protein